jgi:putative transposase
MRKAKHDVPTYLRAYPHSAEATNWGKVEKILDVFTAYTALAGHIKARQIALLFAHGAVNKMVPVNVLTALSARYKQTCQYQVVGMLNGWLALRQDDFSRMVLRSSIPAPLRRELLAINRRKAWYKKDTTFDAEALRLAQGIMRQLRKVHAWPTTVNINLALDEKVAVVQRSKSGCAFAWWVKLSTLDAGKPIYLPLYGNSCYSKALGTRKSFVQLNLSSERGLSAALINECPQKPYQPKTEVLALDTGLCYLFATDTGDLLGSGVFTQLKVLDKLVTDCASGRQAHGLQVRCARYDALVRRVRGLLECEMGRILNTLVARARPAEIVLEALDFRDVQLSRRMNRILRNFGRGIVKDKLQALGEEYGIQVTEVPAAYTSQECPNCHHVEKANRQKRDKFECRKCGLKRHADAVGAQNIRSRRSWPEVAWAAGFGYAMRREAVLSRVRDTHQQWRAQHRAVRMTRSASG